MELTGFYRPWARPAITEGGPGGTCSFGNDREPKNAAFGISARDPVHPNVMAVQQRAVRRQDRATKFLLTRGVSQLCR
jgi:hypothetical protein